MSKICLRSHEPCIFFYLDPLQQTFPTWRNARWVSRNVEIERNCLHTGTPISATRRWLLVSFSTELICWLLNSEQMSSYSALYSVLSESWMHAPRHDFLYRKKIQPKTTHEHCRNFEAFCSFNQISFCRENIDKVSLIAYFFIFFYFAFLNTIGRINVSYRLQRV